MSSLISSFVRQMDNVCFPAFVCEEGKTLALSKLLEQKKMFSKRVNFLLEKLEGVLDVGSLPISYR